MKYNQSRDDLKATNQYVVVIYNLGNVCKVLNDYFEETLKLENTVHLIPVNEKEVEHFINS